LIAFGQSKEGKNLAHSLNVRIIIKKIGGKESLFHFLYSIEKEEEGLGLKRCDV
jgi:hypothetical protein